MGRQSREKWGNRECREIQQKDGGFRYQCGLEKACLFIIRWGIYLLMFTPLLINTKFFFPFVAPKTTFFRIIVEIIFAAYIFLVFSNSSKYRPRVNILTIALTLFLGVFILASFTGINLERSFWSTYERMTGILTMLHLYAFFIILVSIFKKREDWEKFLGVSVIVGVFLSLYILRGDEVSTRGGGTIGNTSFMAAYLLFDIFFAIILLLSNFLKRGRWPLFWQIFSGISLLIMLPVFLNSTARGAIISFFLGLFLLALGYLIFSQKKAFRKLALGIILASVILGTALLIFQPSFVKNKIDNKIDAILKEMKPRLVVWEKGLKGFQERPILGWGPENFNVVFLKYFNPCTPLLECGGEIWFDRVHNIVFDTLVTTGIFGLLAYFAIFGVAIHGLINSASRVAERRSLFLPLGLAVLLIAYFFQNLLVFDMINTYLVFFLSLGFINFLTQKTRDFQEETKIRPINPIFGLAVIAAILSMLWWGNIQPMVANYYIIKALSTQYIDEASLFFQKSLSSHMNKYEARENFTQKIVRVFQEGISDELRPALQEVIELTETEMEKSIQENPLDFRPHLFLGELYVNSYTNSYSFSKNPEKIKRAEEVLTRAIELSPTNQQGYWQLAEAKTSQGKAVEALPILEKGVALEPRLGYAHWYLAVAYDVIGDYASAKKGVLGVAKYGFLWQANTDSLRRMMDIFHKAGDDAGLIPLFQDALEHDPKNARVWFVLALSYANLGEYQKAREAAQKSLEIKSSPALEEFLEQLPQ